MSAEPSGEMLPVRDTTLCCGHSIGGSCSIAASGPRVSTETEPPSRYSQGKLIQEMEKRGLGTKATRHAIIERLLDVKYVVNDPLEPTCLGRAVIDALSPLGVKHLDMPLTPEKVWRAMNQK